MAGLEYGPVDQRTARADGTELEAHRPRLRALLRARGPVLRNQWVVTFSRKKRFKMTGFS